MRKFIFIILLFAYFFCAGSTQADNLMLLGAGGGGIPGCPISSQPTNLLSNPNTFSDWNVNNVTINAAATDDPCTGAADASQLLDNTSSSAHQIYNTTTLTANEVTTSACFFKQSTGRYVVLGYGSGSDEIWIGIDTQAGTITQQSSSGSGSVTGSSISADGSGWYYAKITGSVSDTFVATGVAISDTGAPGSNAPSYIGTGTGVFVYYCRLSAGTQ